LKETRPLQSIIDPFVKSVGGELVCDLIENRNLPSNADYLFRQHNVIAELKSLQAGGFINSFHRKLGDLFGKWDRQGKLRVYGTVKIESGKLPLECQHEMFSVMGESLQKHVVATANKQIKSTKALLEMPDAKGLLWVASDGNDDFQPNIVWYLMTKILQKKKETGDPAFSSVDGFAYFNPRMPAIVVQASEPALLFWGGARKPDEDGDVLACLELLSNAWFQYVSRTQGITVRSVLGRPEDARFPGVDERLPKIAANYQPSKRNGPL
jgi:hypothetical protein